MAILERDGYRCVYCGRTPTETILEVDHVLPRARGGSNEPTNLVTACQACNGGKNASLIALPDPLIPQRPLPTWYLERGLTPTRRPRRLDRNEVWPVGIGQRRGWPLPDGAWDERCGTHTADFLPWAVSQVQPNWYIGFYSCPLRHGWTCGFGTVAGWSEIASIQISPFEISPTADYLFRHGINPAAMDVRRVTYPGQLPRRFNDDFHPLAESVAQ